MADTIGWISLHRALQDHWIWKDANKFKWWVDILFTVNNSDAKVNLGFEVYDCKRGQSLLSIQSWATRWNVSKDTARNFLRLLEKEKMIECVSIGKSTRLTVCKYDEYQSGLHVKQTASKRQANATPTQTIMINNDNNDNKKSVPPTLIEVMAYFLENGYQESLAQKAFKHYDIAGWKDTNGKIVKNWKQKMNTVWFKDENKIQPVQQRKMVY